MGGEKAEELTGQVGGVAAVPRGRVDDDHPYSLSPAGMLGVPSRTRIVLPSPNGAELTLAAAGLHVPIVAGCLRNAAAVADALADATVVAVVAAGERRADGSLRPASEDLLGVGAIVEHLGGQPSPEASAASAVWRSMRDDIRTWLLGRASGRELVAIGHTADVELAAEFAVSSTVPCLREGAYSVLRSR